MKRFTVLSILLSLFLGMVPMGSPLFAQDTATDEDAQMMQITSTDARPTMAGSAEQFTGVVQIEPLFQPNDPSRMLGATVTFAAGARSAWHSHPLGQVLIVTEGSGWVQEEGAEAQALQPGDVVWTPPGVNHWHGATATASMTHIALQEIHESEPIEWLDQVSDEEYEVLAMDTTAVPTATTSAAITTTLTATTTTATTDTATLPGLTPEDVGMISPALAQYMENAVFADLWERSELSARDRSIVTVAALIARNHPSEMSYYFEMALDNGVTPSELSEIITHLAFYAGWTNAMSAVGVTQEIFTERGVEVEQLPLAAPELLPLDEESEARRAAIVEQTVGPVSPGLVQYTGELLFQDLWLRPDLAPRDRSLATVSALIAASQVGQIGFHLNRAMDNGLTQTEAGEVLTHLAFYAGWPNAFSAVPVVQGVFEGRAE